MNTLELLKKHWGYHEFRPLQKEAIDSVLSGGNALVLMPTGAGKSLCYQLPALQLNQLVLVVSPLIALMKDQVDDARKHGIDAFFINSSLRREEREQAYSRLKRGEGQLLYVTPERFRKEDFLAIIRHRPLGLLAVDEAHCISEWGHDFRPDYTRLGEIRQWLGNPPTMALTATATRAVQQDILQQLRLPAETPKFAWPVARPNLQMSVQEVYGLDEKIRNFVFLHHQYLGAKIVYFLLVDTLKKFSLELNKLQISHGVYHGQLGHSERKKQQKKFLSDPNGLILATPAFGLGVNKPDVRMVIHGEMPGSIEAYYQEVGRAGRDGLPAHCVLFYDEDDVSISMDFLKWANPEPEFIRRVCTLIRDHELAVRQQGYEYLRDKLLFYHSRDFRLETAVKLLDRWGVLENFHDVKNWKIVDEIPEAYLDKTKYEASLKVQQKKLLQMVQLMKSEEPIQQQVEEYFELS